MRVLHVIPGSEEGPSFVFAKSQVQGLSGLGVSVRSFFLQARTNPLAILRAVRQARGIVRGFNPDLIHAHYGTATSAFCAGITSLPLVITFRGSDIQGAMDVTPLRAWSAKALSRLSARRARAAIFVSEALREKLPIRVPVTEVIPSGVDLDRFHPMSRAEARAALRWAADTPVVLFNSGRRPRLKRADLAEAAVGRARQSIPALRLQTLAGDTPFEQLPVLINACDMVLMTSDREGSPNIVKEALACDVPVVSVDVGDVRYRVRGVENCQIVERDVTALADAIIHRVRSGRGLGGRQRVSEICHQRCLERILDVYRRVLRI